MFLAIDGIVERWNIEDSRLILDLISNTNNNKIGIKYDKNRSQIWKRRKHLLIEEYRALKEAILELGNLGLDN
jgi:hypothetical protein